MCIIMQPQAHLKNGVLGVNVQPDVVEVQGTEYVIVKVVRPTAKRKHDLATPKIVYPNQKSEVLYQMSSLEIS